MVTLCVDRFGKKQIQLRLLVEMMLAHVTANPLQREAHVFDHWRVCCARGVFDLAPAQRNPDCVASFGLRVSVNPLASLFHQCPIVFGLGLEAVVHRRG